MPDLHVGYSRLPEVTKTSVVISEMIGEALRTSVDSLVRTPCGVNEVVVVNT